MTSIVELGWDTYSFQEIRSMKEVREIFPDGVADFNNWLFCSTGGFHGTKESLNYVEGVVLGNGPHPSLPGESWSVTVLILHPRLCVLKWGHLDVNINDVDFLRGVVTSTIEQIILSQKDNVKT